MIHIDLNQEEILQGAIAGAIRNTNAVCRNAKGVNGSERTHYWQNHIEGALAEMAVAKATNKFWSSGDKSNLDIGDWEIRCTPNPRGELVMRKRDVELGKQDKWFILVRGKYGSYDLIGWILGKDGMQDRYWKQVGDRPPAWFIPESALTPFK